MKTDVSVIVPVYNAQKHLRECIDSILSQNVNLELICVDDGSTDNSVAILEEYAKKDARVHVIKQQNQYAGAARNRGMKAARGEYITFLDADDMLLPGVLEKMRRYMQTLALDTVKYGFYYLTEGDGRTYTTPYSRLSTVPLRLFGKVLSAQRHMTHLLQVPDTPWNGMYRRAFLEQEEIQFNGLRCVNDRSFYIHCLLRAKRIAVFPRVSVCYRIGQNSSLIGQKANHFDCQIGSFHIIRALLKDAEPQLRQTVLEQEIRNLFGWYERLVPISGTPRILEQQLTEFLRTVDEREYGKDYFREFPYCGLYHQLRYGSTQARQRGFLKHLQRFYRENSLRCALAQRLHLEERGWRT